MNDDDAKLRWVHGFIIRWMCGMYEAKKRLKSVFGTTYNLEYYALLLF